MVLFEGDLFIISSFHSITEGGLLAGADLQGAFLILGWGPVGAFPGGQMQDFAVEQQEIQLLRLET